MRNMLVIASLVLGLITFTACGGASATATPAPTPTSAPSASAVQLVAYMDALEELRGALATIQDPDGPSGSLENAIAAARDVAAFTPFFAGLPDAEMVSLLAEYGPQMQALNASVAEHAVRVAGIQGTGELIAVIQQGPAFAIGSVDGNRREPTVDLGEIVDVTADPIGHLLTTEDVSGASGGADFAIVRRDLKQQAGAIDPSLTYVVEQFRSNVFTEDGSARSLALTVAEYTTGVSASLHARLATQGMEPLEPAIGDSAAFIEANASGIGSMVAFRSGNWFVALHTAQPGGDPLVDTSALIELARLVEGRLTP